MKPHFPPAMDRSRRVRRATGSASALRAFHRQFASYLGVNRVRRLGTTAGYARQDQLLMLDRQIVAGVRARF